MDMINPTAAAPGEHTLAVYTIADLAGIWRCSRDVIYDLLLSGKLKGFKVGRNWRITHEERLNYEHGAQEQTDKSDAAVCCPSAVKIH